MKADKLGLLMLAGLTAGGAAVADCEMPTLVAAIPDGTAAREAELLAAQSEVRAYILAMDAYIACENEELEAGRDSATSEYLFQMTSRIESARREVDAVATRFNDEVDAFRATSQTLAPVSTQPPLAPPQSGPAAPR